MWVTRPFITVVYEGTTREFRGGFYFGIEPQKGTINKSDFVDRRKIRGILVKHRFLLSSFYQN